MSLAPTPFGNSSGPLSRRDTTTIAQRFNAGAGQSCVAPVPKGRLILSSAGRVPYRRALGRPFGTWGRLTAKPSVETLGYSRMSLRDKDRRPGQGDFRKALGLRPMPFGNSEGLYVARAASAAKRLWNEAQGWTEGTTLGVGCGGDVNPDGVVARRAENQPPAIPSGHNPLGVGGHRGAITQGWRCANPGLCYTTPLGLKPAAFIIHSGISNAACEKMGDMGNMTVSRGRCCIILDVVFNTAARCERGAR